jgi:phosphomannomutase/phosphoglucomutase
VTLGKLFGTNGVRGVINEELTVEIAVRLGKAIGTYFEDTVVIASDTRDSGGMVKAAVASGLMSVGVKVIDIGVAPTPALQYYVGSNDGMSGGVMITASHNPPEFNGIKCVGPTGQELIREAEEKIESLYEEEIDCNEWNEIGITETATDAIERYVDAILRRVDVEAIRGAKLTAVLDCANGASYISAPMLLRRLGVRAITLNANPQGDFPGHPSEPTEENLKDLMALVRSANADLGIAHDGDADRAVFISDKGDFVSGDKSLSIVSKYILKKKQGLMVTPISSSSMVEDVVKETGSTIMHTAVGSPIVARAMFENKAVFGGEENGGMIFPKHQMCRDGAMTVAVMLECIAKHGKLSEQIELLPKYHMEKRKIDCPNSLKSSLLRHLKDANKDARADLTDGLKLLYDDGWVLARPSGTEPKFRIFSESRDRETALFRANETEIKAIEFVERILSPTKTEEDI